MTQVNNSLTQQNRVQKATPANLRAVLESDGYQKRLEQILGGKSQCAAFVSAMITIANGNSYLQNCSAQSMIASACMAASLNLNIGPSLGLAYIVPYKGTATLQVGYKGYIQLALRSNNYKSMVTQVVYEGEIVGYNKFVDQYTFGNRVSDNVIGYYAYFKTMGGFEKALFMTCEEVEAHKKRYVDEKLYTNPRSTWVTHYDNMAMKTVLKKILSKYGQLSVELQQAFEYDDKGVSPEVVGLPIVDEPEVVSEIPEVNVEEEPKEGGPF
jgi:recombination protein RecT